LKKSSEILQHYWGFKEFRPLQENIVDSAIYGHDTVALMATGGGKSLCYQIPGIAREGITLIISPLISLMQDQVKSLQEKGLRAQAVYSGLSYKHIDILLDNAIYGGIDFLFVSPERLKTRLFIERLKKMNLGLIAIDEAHCISEWGHDFRPTYTEIAEIREHHPSTPMIALTATATKKVLDDICTSLKLNKPNIFQGTYFRENLVFKVEECQNKILKILETCKLFNSSTGIVYCKTRRGVKDVARILHANDISVGLYHGGMTHEDRTYMLNNWLSGKIMVMVSTNAFGMGIDKANVRFVLHHDVPNNLEAYVQEAGRAGRDGETALSAVFYDQKDLNELNTQLKEQFPDKETVHRVYRALCNKLQVAIGSGLDENYNFEILNLAKQFDLSYKDVYYSLKLLELNGDLSFSEGTFSPTKLKFAIGNKELYSFQIANENLSPLISLLSRSYPGIFQLFFEINENEFCKRLKIGRSELKKKLEQLEKMGIIDIKWSSSLPSVTFLHERLPEDYINLSPNIYFHRKSNAENRLKTVIEYLKSTECRVKTLLDYFGEEIEPCQECDNCKSNGTIGKKEDVKKQMVSLLKKPTDFSSLIAQLPLSEAMAKEYLRELLLDEIVREENGFYQKLS
jgi:ATP-dependent DNA helicase RecQ